MNASANLGVDTNKGYSGNSRGRGVVLFSSLLSLLGGIILGALGAFFFDPIRGRRRRIVARDRALGLQRDTRVRARRLGHHFRNVLSGLQYRIRDMLTRREPPPDDETLIARVRSASGRVLSHLGAIEVNAKAGVVALSGPIFADEVRRLIRRVRSVRGVRSVVNELTVHDRGAGHDRRDRFERESAVAGPDRLLPH